MDLILQYESDDPDCSGSSGLPGSSQTIQPSMVPSRLSSSRPPSWCRVSPSVSPLSVLPSSQPALICPFIQRPSGRIHRVGSYNISSIGFTDQRLRDLCHYISFLRIAVLALQETRQSASLKLMKFSQRARTVGILLRKRAPAKLWHRNIRARIVNANAQDVTREFADYFTALLRQPEAGEIALIDCCLYRHTIVAAPPTFTLMTNAIKSLNQYSAPGPDGITFRMLLAAGPFFLHRLHQLISVSWMTNELPLVWLQATLIAFPKVPNAERPADSRGIALQQHVLKVYARLLLDELLVFIPRLPDYQSAYQRNRSTVDQLFIINKVLDEHRSHGHSIHVVFIDIEKAFDSVRRSSIITALEVNDVPDYLIQRIIRLFVSDSFRIRLGSAYTDPVFPERGIQQGSPISAYLFILVLDLAIKELQASIARDITTPALPLLLGYADDIALLVSSGHDASLILQSLSDHLLSHGLRINARKTKVMHIASSPPFQLAFQLLGVHHDVEPVNQFKYLGVWIDANHYRFHELHSRLQKANRAYHATRHIITDRRAPLSSKMYIYKSVISPVLLYGSEVWSWTRAIRVRIRDFEYQVLHTIALNHFGAQAVNRYMSSVRLLRRKLRCTPLTDRVRISMLRWFGHIQRQDDISLLLRARDFLIRDTRVVGRPRYTLQSCTRDALLRLQFPVGPALLDALQDRRLWRNLLHSIKQRRDDDSDEQPLSPQPGALSPVQEAYPGQLEDELEQLALEGL